MCVYIYIYDDLPKSNKISLTIAQYRSFLLCERITYLHIELTKS